MTAWLEPIAPPHTAVEIPAVMAAASEPPFRAGPRVRAPVAREGLEVPGAHVLTPLPNVAGHVIQAELVRRFGPYRVSAGGAWQYFPRAVRQSPSCLPAKKPHQGLIGPSPAWSIPRHRIGVIAPTKGKIVLPMRTPTGREFPLDF